TNTKQGSITIVKKIIGGNGTTATFGFSIGGPTPSTPSIATALPSPSTGPIHVKAGNSYSVTEVPQAGWNRTGLVCATDFGPALVGTPASFTVPPGVNVTCTVTNTKAATLTVVKHVVNTGGGTRAASDWTLSVPGASPASFAGSESGTSVTIP